jgi:hypothetical protein
VAAKKADLVLFLYDSTSDRPEVEGSKREEIAEGLVATKIDLPRGRRGKRAFDAQISVRDG